MAQSLANLYVHAIFSTKERVKCLTPEVRSELYPYLVTVLNTMKCPAIEIGAIEDHIHVLCHLHRTVSVSKLIEDMKVPTSKWIKGKGGVLRNFAWQGGYGAFTVSHSDIDRVREYIQTQEEHHRTMTFQDEFRLFLERNQIEYDERYVWD